MFHDVGKDVKGAIGYKNGQVYIGVEIPKYDTAVKLMVNPFGIKNASDFMANTRVHLEVGCKKDNDVNFVQLDER